MCYLCDLFENIVRWFLLMGILDSWPQAVGWVPMAIEHNTHQHVDTTLEIYAMLKWWKSYKGSCTCHGQMYKHQWLPIQLGFSPILDRFIGECMILIINIINDYKEPAHGMRIVITIKCWYLVDLWKWESLYTQITIWVNTNFKPYWY